MKPSMLLLTLAVSAFAQTAPPSSDKLNPLAAEGHAAEAPAPLARIDLDFRGGPPAALVEAISKAVGKQLNVIIDEADAQVRLPPIHVRQATVLDIFAALATATMRDINIPAGPNTYQSRQVKSQFMPNNSASISDETVWSFVSNEPETQQALLASTRKPKPALRHFQLGSYLGDKLTVEDITTTIRTGWELLGVKEQPELKFHKETGILIAVGDAELIEQIPMVLQQLPIQASAGNDPAPPRPAPPRPPSTAPAPPLPVAK